MDNGSSTQASTPAQSGGPESIVYISAVSGLRYTNVGAAGDISGIVVNGHRLDFSICPWYTPVGKDEESACLAAYDAGVLARRPWPGTSIFEYRLSSPVLDGQHASTKEPGSANVELTQKEALRQQKKEVEND